jgi:hypothetical protein
LQQGRAGDLGTMKILVAIQSDNNAQILAKKTLSWAPRAGFNCRIFIPYEAQRQAYEAIIEDVNYNEYLDLQKSMIEVSLDPKAYAKAEGYNLLLLLPDNLRAWKRNNNRDKMVIDYSIDIGAARKELSDSPKKMKIDFDNGAILKRL